MGGVPVVDVIRDEAIHWRRTRQHQRRIERRRHVRSVPEPVARGKHRAVELGVDVRVLFARVRIGIVHHGTGETGHHASLRRLGVGRDRVGEWFARYALERLAARDLAGRIEVASMLSKDRFSSIKTTT